MRAGQPGPSGPLRSAQIVVFQESLYGVVRAVEAVPPEWDDRLVCAFAAENLLSVHGGPRLTGCVLQDLTIAVDVGAAAAGDGLAGLVRSGLVRLAGSPALTVADGDFELLTRVPGDGRRLRYRLRLHDPDGVPWLLHGTKLVVDEAPGGLVRRIWTETSTLYLVLAPAEGGPGRPSYVGVVGLRPSGFARQLASLRGEPGPEGGWRAAGRLARAFWSAISEVYLDGAGRASAIGPGIEAAFGDPVDRSAGQ